MTADSDEQRFDANEGFEVIADPESPADSVVERESINPTFYGWASVGDIILDSGDTEIPDGWHEVNGEELLRHEWPEFAESMGLSGPTFTLPMAERSPQGHRYIIKLGERRR